MKHFGTKDMSPKIGMLPAETRRGGRGAGTLLILLLTAAVAGRAVGGSLPDCPQPLIQAQLSSGTCAPPAVTVLPLPPSGEATAQSAARKEHTGSLRGAVRPELPSATAAKTVVYFFWGRGCPHCEEERRFLDGLKQREPALEIREFEVWHDGENAALLAQMLRMRGQSFSGVPVTFIDDQSHTGFSGRTKTLLERKIRECGRTPCSNPATAAGPAGGAAPPPQQPETITLPLLGDLAAGKASLPLLTLAIAGMDSFNPCAFFVLFTLLGLLVHARSRRTMLLVGGIFVFFSGLIYFLFMAAWLNLFLVMGHVGAITLGAGLVSLAIAAINIKDFFLFKQGVSLTIPDSAKPKLFERMRRLLHSRSVVSILLGTTVLALLANAYELLCTAGFPMLYTRILTLHGLSGTAYYLYLALYNVIYVVPLFAIVCACALTLGKRQLSEWQGRVLKLVSGSMMGGLGLLLIVKPALLNSVGATALLLGLSLACSLLLALLVRRRERHPSP